MGVYINKKNWVSQNSHFLLERQKLFVNPRFAPASALTQRRKKEEFNYFGSFLLLQTGPCIQILSNKFSADGTKHKTTRILQLQTKEPHKNSNNHDVSVLHAYHKQTKFRTKYMLYCVQFSILARLHLIKKQYLHYIQNTDTEGLIPGTDKMSVAYFLNIFYNCTRVCAV